MKRTFTLLAAALATTAAAQKPYHRDLAVLEVNREAPRTEFVEFASRDEALTRSFEQSDAYRSLDGVWKFRYARDGRRRRHFGVERHPRSGQLGVAGTRHADLRQHALRIRRDRSRAAAPARGDSGRRLPPHLHRSRSVGGTQDLPDDRRRQIGRLRLCQRPRSGLQRRFEESGAIPHRPPPASGREYAGAQNDAVEHRFLPRSAGLLAHQRHRPKRPTRCAISRSYRRSTTATARGFSR